MFDTSALAAVLNGYNSQQTPAPVTPAPAAAPSGPFGNLSAILNGDANYGSIIRQIGGGMANMSNAGGDPYLAFSQGFGGAQQYATTQEKEAAERAAAAEKQRMDANLALQRLVQDQSQHDATLGQNQSQFDTRMGQDQSQFDQRMTLEQAQEKRQQQVADDARRKTDAEIARLAKREDVSPTTMLKIEELARKAVPEFSSPEEAKQIMDAERERLIKQVKSSRLSDGPGVTEGDTLTTPVRTATGPNGEKLQLSPDGTQWVPVQ